MASNLSVGDYVYIPPEFDWDAWSSAEVAIVTAVEPDVITAERTDGPYAGAAFQAPATFTWEVIS